MAEHRPNPEKLLQRAQEEERSQLHGKLKIYLGSAPGVGKTYTMLQDALAKRAQGLDVVVGVVESHGRQEIISLIKDFEVLPRQPIEYRGKTLTEFDLDAALKRNPGLILIDEMAHTNAPGLRHAKRWQDIKEILDLGIDVYTTLNVQHIESLNDVVSQIIHARVKETVPDFMLELADTIELVDLPPEDLLKRLQEGKVYIPKQANLATEHFFRKGNLIALRELALRATAERVGAQVLLYRQGQGIKHIWPTNEKILVCVGSGADSAKVIRAARRMATSLQAEWIAVHVESPRLNSSDEERNNAMQNLRLAEKLGAETLALTGYDIVKEVMNVAHERNVTKIMLAKRIRPRWKELLFGSLSDELVRHSGEVDVYIVTGEDISAKAPAKPFQLKHNVPWVIYSVAIAIVALATFINFILYPYLQTSNLILVYLIGVTMVALFDRVGPSILASLLSVLIYDFLFVPPFFSFFVADPQYLFTLIGMLLVTLGIGFLTLITRRQAAAAHFSEQRTATLHSLSRQLASTRGSDKLLEIAVRYIAEIFDSEVLALLPEDNTLVIHARYKTAQVLSAKELGVAQWVYDLGQIAGLGTDTLPFSDALYIPLLASQGTIGVLRVHPVQPERLFAPEEIHLLEDCANQVALALEVDRLQDQSKQSELETEADRARSALLKAVSHDLRTPLAAIMGFASTLTEMAAELKTKEVKKYGNNIYFESEQLSRLINNLLQITYLEAESVKLQKEFNSLKDVIHFVIKTEAKKLEKRSVQIQLPPNLPIIPFDSTLIQEVIINLIDNAIKFTPHDTPIEISAALESDRVIVSVEDHGPGIAPDEINKLFEKFYRGKTLTTERGMGLGLTICYRIIQAHGGKIWAENRPEGGAAFRFTLPLPTG